MSSTKKSTKYFKLDKEERKYLIYSSKQKNIIQSKKKKKERNKVHRVKELRGLERVSIENSQNAELIDQLIKEESI